MTVNGTTSTVNSTNTTISDSRIEFDISNDMDLELRQRADERRGTMMSKNT